MNKRTRIDLIQNITIVFLGVSAFLLLLLVISYEAGQNGQLTSLSDLVSPPPSAGGVSTSTDLTGMSAPFNLVVTSDYGRSGYLYTAEEAATEQATGLLREALGSAGEAAGATEEDFRRALSESSVYFDYLSVLPASVLSEQLGVEFQHSGEVRQLLIAGTDSGHVVLFLRSAAGDLYRYPTAISFSVLQEVVAAFTPNRAFFAFEGGEAYTHLDPYSVLWDGMMSLPSLSAATPALAADAESLLTLLDFNAHTNSHYTQSDGTEVIVESPRSLHIQPDGVIIYSGDEDSASPLYHVSFSGESPTETEAALAVLQLGEALLSSETPSAATLCLSAVEETAQGYTVTLNYQVGGIPVYFSDGLGALTAKISGSTITGFTLRFRQYALLSETYSPLPARQAAAIALNYPGAFLTLGYVDQGNTTVYPEWLAQ